MSEKTRITIDDLNNSDSLVFKQTVAEQRVFIINRLQKIRNRYLNDEMGCVGNKETIVKHLNNGPAQNLVNTFFNYKMDKCILCNGCKGTNGIRQIERAHYNKFSTTPRETLLLEAINELYVDDTTPVKSGVILKRFIQKHDNIPIYKLCNLCHNKYDN